MTCHEATEHHEGKQILMEQCDITTGQPVLPALGLSSCGQSLHDPLPESYLTAHALWYYHKVLLLNLAKSSFSITCEAVHSLVDVLGNYYFTSR